VLGRTQAAVTVTVPYYSDRHGDRARGRSESAALPGPQAGDLGQTRPGLGPGRAARAAAPHRFTGNLPALPVAACDSAAWASLAQAPAGGP
jgi:hypothetical protein